MSATLDPTIGGSNANSFGDLTEADAYFDEHLYAAVWAALTGAPGTDKKIRAMIMGARRIATLPWDGTTVTYTQALPWPRVGMCDANGTPILTTVIPFDIKVMQFETALWLLSSATNPGAVDPLSKFSALKVGPIALSLRESAPRNSDQLPDVVWRLAAPYLVDDSSFARG